MKIQSTKSILAASVSSLLLCLGASFAQAKIDCSAKDMDREFVTPKDCKLITIKAWGGGSASKDGHALGGAFATSDFEIPPASILRLHIGSGGKADVNGGDGDATSVSFNGQPLIVALGGQSSQMDSCMAYPEHQRGISHYGYAKDMKPAASDDEDYIRENARYGKHGYSYGVPGKEGVCGLVVVKCKKDIRVKL